MAKAKTEKIVFLGTGRRKKSIARVRLMPGTGVITVNGRELNELGEGIQYAFNILLQIIEIIHNVKTTRKAEDFTERLIE